MAARSGARGKRKTAPSMVAVSEDERWHLIEDCAYFRGDRFRPVAPGSVRESDRRAVAADVDRIIGGPHRRKGK